MIELLLLFFTAWVDSPEGWQPWTIIVIDNRTDVKIACDSDKERTIACTIDKPTRWIYIWKNALFGSVQYDDSWGCPSVLWHELLHAQDYEFEREDWHGGSLRMSEMPCHI